MDGQFYHFDATSLPGWVPENVTHYLMHTVIGLPIRELARRQGCHASTVLRQVRRVESRRDDALVDAGLVRLGDQFGARAFEDMSPTQAELASEAARVLRRLCESGAVLAVAEGMPNAIVMRGSNTGAGARTAVVTVEIAQAMALCDWITCAGTGKIARYHVTAAGRAMLSRLVAEAENRARTETDGFAEDQALFARPGGDTRARKSRFMAVESPLIALARRREKDGSRFLDDDMVRAGERLREDFELAQMGHGAARDWCDVLAAAGSAALATDPPIGRAQQRLTDAMDDLGPGLADIALRCCCYLEGLERTEKRMGWSARSGKIVLRIALQRLARHYKEAARHGGDLIG